ncbi:MAG: oligosaccharide flippase family protein [Clostridia bacterium]|nr:oligosaccharide flippase family protein [Clostridia bacterium]
MITKMKSLYNSLSVEKKSALWFAMCNIANKGISLIVVPIYTRILSMEDYGTYGIFLSWLDLLTIIVTLEISRGHYPVGITKHDKDIDGYTVSTLSLGSLVTIVSIALFCIFHKTISELINLPTALIFCMLLFLLVYPAWEFWRIQERFAYRYKLMVFVTLAISMITPVFAILGILCLKMGLLSAVSSKLLFQGMVSVILYVYFVNKSKKKNITRYWKEAFVFNIAMVPYFLSTMVLNQADRIMIDKMIGSAEAAIYSVSYSIAMLLLLVNNAVSDSFLPWMYRKLKEKSYAQIEPVTNKLLLVVAGLNMLLILFAPEAIALFAPEKYQAAIWIIPPLASSTFFMFLFQRYINVEIYYGATKINSAVSISIAILNIILNYFCINQWGYFAAGYTTLVSYMLFAAVHYIIVRTICRKNCNGEQIFTIRYVLLIGLGFLALAFSLMLLYPHAVIRYTIILLACIGVFIKRKQVYEIVKNSKRI